MKPPVIKLFILNVLILLGLTVQSLSYGEDNPSDMVGNNVWEKEPQIEIGTPNLVVDSLGNLVSLPKKIIFLNWKIDSHSMGPETKEAIEKYIQKNPRYMYDTKVRVNQFTPTGEFKRLIANKKIRWWWRVFPGIPTTLFSLGGRLFGGDHYNPFTNTINIYSNLPPVFLHEAGHAVDTAEKVEEGWADYYILGRSIPMVTLHQEFVASEKAIHYLEDEQDRKAEDNAYRILFPAYGTYVGGTTSLPYSDVAGALVGHVVSIVPRYNAKMKYTAQDNAKWGSAPVTDLAVDPINKSLMEDYERREEILKQMFLSEAKKNKDLYNYPFMPSGGAHD